MKNFRMCFVVFILVFSIYMIMSPIYVRGELTGTVSGRVIDEYDQGMRDVEIEVYSSDGAYVGSWSTFSNGSFAIDLVVGKSYNLYFMKEGYTKITKGASLRVYLETVDLGDIVLLKAVRLYCSILSLVASPGDKLLLPFVIRNIGEETETVEFLISSPSGWSTRVLSEAGREVRKIELSSQASLNLQLEVSIPVASTGKNNLRVTAVGRTNSTLDFVIEVQPLSEPIILCQFPGKSATPGGTVRFQVRLKNLLGVEMRFKLSVDSVPPGWIVYVKSTSGEYVNEATLGSNEFVDLLVEVKTSATAKVGEDYEIVFKAESCDGNIVDSLPLSVSLKKVEETKITVNVKFSDITVQAGQIVQYPITIVNSGDANRTLLLSVEPPVDWKAVFKSGALEISSLFLEAGRSENLIIEVTPPSTVNLGSYTIPVRVKSEDGAIYAETSLKVTIVGSYALKLEPSTLLTSVTAGGTLAFTAKITNSGYTSVTTIKVGVSAPTGWDVTITPVSMQSLKPGESYTFDIAVNTPSDAVAGDYMITLMGLSDQVNSDSVQVRVTVTAPTSWGLIGVGVAVVMIIALLVVFIRFRRR